MVRNFYICGDIDGRRTYVTGGPARRDGGLRLDLTQRSDGAITTALTVYCRCDDGELITSVYGASGDLVYRHATKR